MTQPTTAPLEIRSARAARGQPGQPLLRASSQLPEKRTMTDPSGTYNFTAKYITGERRLSFNVDPATGALSGTLGTAADASDVAGQWDDANSHITFNDAFAGEILFTHFFDGYVSQQIEIDGRTVIIGSLGPTMTSESMPLAAS